ncbi:uncharacterized protein DS421_16g544910 [Arachis hypogaea]|nr:uncharacterized protein DS421_16g544910 [Arachis hypogaea]
MASILTASPLTASPLTASPSPPLTHLHHSPLTTPPLVFITGSRRCALTSGRSTVRSTKSFSLFAHHHEESRTREFGIVAAQEIELVNLGLGFHSIYAGTV